MRRAMTTLIYLDSIATIAQALLKLRPEILRVLARISLTEATPAPPKPCKARLNVRLGMLADRPGFHLATLLRATYEPELQSRP